MRPDTYNAILDMNNVRYKGYCGAGGCFLKMRIKLLLIVQGITINKYILMHIRNALKILKQSKFNKWLKLKKNIKKTRLEWQYEELITSYIKRIKAITYKTIA